jgi:hypothetical protein
MKRPSIPRHQSSPLQNDAAVSTIIGVILMVFLVVVLTAVVASVIFGLVGPIQKSAYIAVDAQYTTQNGYPLVTLRNLQGDTGHLSGSGRGYPLAILISSGGSSGTATPDPAGLVWAPGTTLLITRTSTGYNVTDDLTRIQGTPLGFPGNEITVSVIDTTQNILVYSRTITGAGSSGSVTPTVTPTIITPTVNTPTVTTTSTIITPTITTPTVTTITSTVTTPTVTPTNPVFARGPGLSVTGWIRFTSPPAPVNNQYRWATMVVDGNSDANQRYMMQHDRENTRFEFFFKTADMAATREDATSILSTTSPVQNTWYFLAGVYNQTDGRSRLYVNGVLEATSALYDTSGPAPSPGLYQVGGPNGVHYPGNSTHGRLPGDVTGVSVVNQALQEPELLSIYQAGPP